MAKTIYLDKLLRLTLTRRGKAVAKHPLLREGAVEAVKATPLSQIETAPLWQATGDNVPSLDRFTSGRWQ